MGGLEDFYEVLVDAEPYLKNEMVVRYFIHTRLGHSEKIISCGTCYDLANERVERGIKALYDDERF